MIRRNLAMLLVVSVMLASLPVVAIASLDASDESTSVSFDTPEPTEEPQERPGRTPRPTSRATPQGEPQETQAPMVPVASAPERTAITVGYREPDLLGRAPLLLALLQGYFAEAGFEDVFIVEARDPLAGLGSGELDFAVVDAVEAADAAAGGDSTLRAVAGFQNQGDLGGADGRDLLVAAPGLVSDEPVTVIAFLSAYIRALQDLADPETAAEALTRIEATGVVIEPDTAAGWADAVAVFAPFDGGFHVAEVDDGLGELMVDLESAGIAIPDMSYFIASHTLDIAQALQALEANPDSGLRPPPGLEEISLGMPAAAEGAGPVARAIEAGYFEEAGFTAVDVMDVEQPILGLLNGELDFGVVSVVDAADGVAQGLPLKVLAGHRNGGPDGAEAGDVLVASADLIDQEPSTVAAFLIAYLLGLRDFEASPDGDSYAPYDGGFGDRAVDGGVAELIAQLAGALGEEPDLDALLADVPLEYAQAWWGLPSNPIRVPDASGTAVDPLVTDQESD